MAPLDSAPRSNGEVAGASPAEGGHSHQSLLYLSAMVHSFVVCQPTISLSKNVPTTSSLLGDYIRKCRNLSINAGSVAGLSI